MDDVLEVVRRSGGTRTLLPVTGDGVVRAAGPRRWWPAADVVALAAVGALCWLVAAWVAVAVLVAGSVVIVVGLGLRGQTGGHLLLGLRTVEAATGVPAGVRGLVTARLVTTDLRLGRDPLVIAPRTAAVVPIALVDPWGTVRPGVQRPVLVVDDGRVIDVDAPLVLGRRPSDPSGVRATVALTDLSRTLSRNHVAVAPHAGGLVVRDLGSANGTAVALPGGSFELIAPGVDVVVPMGAQLAVGDRTLVVAQREGAR